MFVCKKNSRRSQMAEGFTKTLGGVKVEVFSSGLSASFVDPIVIDIMNEIGISIEEQTSKCLDEFKPEEFDVVISLCGCGVNLPNEWTSREIFMDWQLDDPEGQDIACFRRVRDEVKERVVQLINDI
eukprot:gene11295-15153_t